MIKNPNVVYSNNNVFLPFKLNFGDYVMEKMWENKEKVCWINAATDETIKYGETVQQAMNIAVSLSRLGVRKGHTVAVFSENRMEFFPCVIGSICTGATITTLNIGYTDGEMKHVLSISKPKYIFCSPNTYKTHEKSLKSLAFLKKIIVFGNDRFGNTLCYNDIAIPNNGSNGLTRNANFEEFEVADVNAYDTMLILYSSGTTGLPKGVMLTHYNILTAACLPGSQDPSRLSFTITPWYHVFGLVGGLTGLVTGRTAIYLPKFDMEIYLKTIEKYKVMQLTVVPPVLVALSKTQSKYDLSSVQLIHSGAAPLHKDTVDAVKTKFPNAVILQGYGMTEVTLGITRDTYNDRHLAKPGSCGYVTAGCVKIVDIETRKSLGPNQHGELCVKGPLVMKGYVGKDLREDLDDEGFFRTGDIGYYDEDKAFFIVDRLKELIKYKAYQVAPAEIEAVLLQHEAVKDVGVIGIAHKAAGEVPLAFVVRQPGSQVSEDDIKQFVAERLSNPKHLRGGVRFIEQIPKNPSGKILRKTLRTMVKKGKSKL